jgi:NAD(P)-dependent dehydrogenase (short-subunit alcohol dehydrogenase family)
MKSFAGKVAAITGAGSGIGRALARQLAREGCHLALSDINLAGVEETAKIIADESPKVHVTTAKLDVSKRDDFYAWADQVIASHGRCNMIFNNAGVAQGTTIEAVSYEDFEWLMGINFWGVVYGTKAFLPHLRASGDGHVINISSLFGLIGVPAQGTYCAAKFAVRGFTETLRQELELEGAPVSATSIHPGGIKTNIAKSSRDGDMGSIGMDDAEASKKFFDKLLSVTSPERAAQIILNGVKRNARRVVVGPDAMVLDNVQRFLPTLYQPLMAAGTRLLVKSLAKK